MPPKSTKPGHRRTYGKVIRHRRTDAKTHTELEDVVNHINEFNTTQKIDRKELEKELGKGRKKHKRNTRRRKSHKKKSRRRRR